MVTRVDRTRKYRNEVIKAWHDKYRSFVEDNMDKPWNWANISCNPNITMEMIKANPDKPWDWYWISRNPNLTMDYINANPDKPWRWNGISCNKFTKSKVEFITQKYRRMLAAYRIQQWWHRIRMDPRHPVGIRRLEREYTELFGPDAP